MEVENQPIEVVYTKAKVSKRLLGYFIDIGLFIMSTLITFSITNIGITKAPFFTQKQAELTQLRNESGLYVDGVVITTYTENEDLFPTYLERKIALRNAIDSFYVNTTYFSDLTVIASQYNNRKIAAKGSGGVALFKEEAGTIIENSVSDEELYNFYKEEINTYSLAYLMNNEHYFNLTKFSWWTSVIEIIILAVIFFTLYFLILPLTCFKRGRQTIGMKLEQIGIITIKAENESKGKYTLRVVFEFFVMVLLNLASFLIPSFVSIGMLFRSKTNSSLVNYVFNDYCVDVTNQKIYFNALEREEAAFKLQAVSIENKELNLK